MMLRLKKVLLPLLLLALLLVVPSPVAAQGAGTLETVSCEEFLADAFLGDAQLSCALLTVPERHVEPDGATIELAVVVVHSRAASPRPDPLVMMQGGPGGSTIETYAPLVTRPDFMLLDERDIILFDQRGTLHSRPNLLCAEDIALVERVIEQRLDRAELERLSLEASAACRERLAREGVNLGAFNSVENAADIEALRVALGYEAINLYGVSYGTLLAQHAMRDHPAGLRSVILDAVAPTSLNFITEIPRSQERAFAAFFAACAADADCAASYPNLEATFEAQVARLNAEPVRIPLTDMETGRTYDAVLTGDDLRDSLFQFLYATELLPLLPAAIEGVAEGRYGIFQVVLPLFLFERTISSGMYLSVICAEDADFSAADVGTEGVRELLAATARADAESLLATCSMWSVPELGPAVDAPVPSEIPTLLLSGRFDPITPPAFAEVVAGALPNSYAFTFPNTAHGALGSEPCAMAIAADFLDAPAAPPDAGCLAALGGPDFLGEGELIESPLGVRLLEWANFNGLGSFWLLLGALVVLLSPLGVWPLIWLVRALMGRRGGPTSDLSQGAAVAALLAGPLALLLIGSIAFLVISTVVEDEAKLLTLAVGLPREWLPVMLLALLVALFVLVMLVGAIALWRGRLWTLPERLYFTVLALAGLLLIGLFAATGFFVNPLG